MREASQAAIHLREIRKTPRHARRSQSSNSGQQSSRCVSRWAPREGLRLQLFRAPGCVQCFSPGEFSKTGRRGNQNEGPQGHLFCEGFRRQSRVSGRSASRALKARSQDRSRLQRRRNACRSDGSLPSAEIRFFHVPCRPQKQQHPRVCRQQEPPPHQVPLTSPLMRLGSRLALTGRQLRFSAPCFSPHASLVKTFVSFAAFAFPHSAIPELPHTSRTCRNAPILGFHQSGGKRRVACTPRNLRVFLRLQSLPWLSSFPPAPEFGR